MQFSFLFFFPKPNVGVDLVSCDLLREGAPVEPVPPVTHWKPDAVVSENSQTLAVESTVSSMLLFPLVKVTLCCLFVS